MGVTVVGVSFAPERLEALDEMAGEEGVKRSAMLARLVDEEVERRRARKGERAPVVLVDGRRFVPARGGRR